MTGVQTCALPIYKVAIEYDIHLEKIRNIIANPTICEPCPTLPPRPETKTDPSQSVQKIKEISEEAVEQEKRGLDMTNNLALELWVSILCYLLYFN